MGSTSVWKTECHIEKRVDLPHKAEPEPMKSASGYVQ